MSFFASVRACDFVGRSPEATASAGCRTDGVLPMVSCVRLGGSLRRRWRRYPTPRRSLSQAARCFERTLALSFDHSLGVIIVL
jgi:hypothetical protein